MWARSKGTSNILSIDDCEVMLIFCFISILITPVCHVSYSFCKPSHLCICWSTKIYTLGIACPNANKFAKYREGHRLIITESTPKCVSSSTQRHRAHFWRHSIAKDLPAGFKKTPGRWWWAPSSSCPPLRASTPSSRTWRRCRRVLQAPRRRGTRHLLREL